MQQNTLLESYLRQLKLPTFAQNYAAIASDVARTGLSCERYLLALCEAELAQRDANRVERCIAQAKLPVLKERLCCKKDDAVVSSASIQEPQRSFFHEPAEPVQMASLRSRDHFALRAVVPARAPCHVSLYPVVNGRN